MKHFMDMYCLKIFDPDDYEEGQRILDAFRDDDQLMWEEEQEEKRRGQGKANGN